MSKRASARPTPFERRHAPRAAERRGPWRRRQMSIPAVFLVLAVGLTVALTFLLGRYVLLELPWRYLIAVNGVTLLAYVYDKPAASRPWWRVPERTLHGLALAGGTPAAWAGQRVLRHKTQKHSFRLRFWFIVAAQVALIVAWQVLKRRGMLG